MKTSAASWLLALVCLAPSSAWAADTLVVCPHYLRTALAPWESHRRAQGHQLTTIEPPPTCEQLQDSIQAAVRAQNIKYLVLIGDVDIVPTAYAQAKVNILWGSEPTIATDQLYADVDGDGVPDLAVGRIPADTPLELQAFVDKLIRYETYVDKGSSRRQIDVVAGVGGFGVIADALIEAAARNIFGQVVPKHVAIQQLPVDPDATCQQISAGSFAWIYLGHGLPTMLDVATTPRGPRPILEVKDVPALECGVNNPLAVLIACYTGAIDARNDSLAEELVLHGRGPIAVIAATRVSMPYGNSVLGCELLRSAFREQPGNLGDIWLRAQLQTLKPAAADDSLRTSLDAVARGVSPPPVDLAGERREHVLLYQLLGDPLQRLRYPAFVRQPTARIAAGPNNHQAR